MKIIKKIEKEFFNRGYCIQKVENTKLLKKIESEI
jgi:hypothetical protein